MKGDEDHGEDRLSALPDILIIYILLRIPNTTLTQTTITTITLSKRCVKKLVVTGYGDCKADEHPDPDPDMLKINAPYILSLKIGGYLLVSNILLLNVSSLVEVNLNFNKCENGATIDENMSGLISSLFHVKEFSIGILCNKVISRLQARGFTFPSNLKVLDSQDVTKSLIWPNTNVDSSNNRGWKYFHIRERSTSSLAGRISVKLLKSKTKVKDRISALPDALLIEILSRLPETKCAIRTSTLSKRWIHLWTYIPTLVFQRGYGNAFLASDFFPSIDKTLTQCRQLKLYKFELRCCHGYDIQFESQVKNWISYALNCNVEELYLELFSEGSEAEFVLDDFFYINSCITKLTLAGCIFIPTGAICWKKLKTLCIHRGIIDEDLIENIQRGSPMLETLELENCSGFMLLNITSKSVKNLIFSGYVDVDDVDIIEINAPNILSLKICGQLLLWKLVLLNVASLVNAHLDYSLDMDDDDNIEQEQMMLKQLILSLQHIKELKIGMTCFTTFFRLEAEGFEFPSNLKVLDSLEGISDWSDWSDLNDSDEDSDLDSITNGD
ncbi:putative F-box/LRR-repeat protein At3g18150 [Rutidosis leptorrhynchoides]|uniref:putative F-box/LRR-repeat protein At3g18150 n=1 Tax=Rutidosis leptorrhynchoides TaxID=125765 RepID=UPI003A99902F